MLLPDWSVWSVALLAAILAPTDAALGQAVITNRNVPERVRRALTVESGLNDGLALPIVLLFGCLASAHAAGDQNWPLFTLAQLALGPVAGVAVGYTGARLLRGASDRGATDAAYEGIVVLALAALAYLAATAIGGNGFIAAFAAGLAFGHAVGGRCRFVFEFAEAEGNALVLVTFLVLGASLLPDAIARAEPGVVVAGIVSLVAVRPLAIWLSLLGTDAAPITRLFFGWFGPRGLASALFALLIVPQLDAEMADAVLAAAVLVVGISAVLHGMTAAPAAVWYGRHVRGGGDRPETMPIESSAMPLRHDASRRS